MRKTMISFVMEKDVLSHVNVIAKADDKSRSQVLRDAVARYVKKQTGQHSTLKAQEASR